MVINCGKDSKSFYSLVHFITVVWNGSPIPENKDLVDKVTEFFMNKIVTIRQALLDKALYMP